MIIQFGDRLLQHMAAARVGSCLQLLDEASAGKPHAFTFPVALLLVGRDGFADGLTCLRPFFLLLFYRLTFPTARHPGILPYEGSNRLAVRRQ